MGARLRQLRQSRGWSLHAMARALRDTARSAGLTSFHHVPVASVQRTIERWESPKSDTTPGDQYELALAHLFARTSAGTITLGPGSDFDTFLTILEQFGTSPQRIRELTTLVAETTTSPVTRCRVDSPTEGRPQSQEPGQARYLRVSLDQLGELLSRGEAAETHDARASSSTSAWSSSASAVEHAAELSANIAPPERDTQYEAFFPVIVNGLPVLVPLDGDLGDGDAMSPFSRRAMISAGIAAAAALSTNDAIQALQRPKSTPALTLAPGASWAAEIYDAVLNPAEAARRAVDSAVATDTDIPAHTALRPMIDRAMQISLTSDFAALERALPSLIGQVETTGTQPADDDRAREQALSDVYAVVAWTLVKADIPIGAWMAAQRAINAAERADDVLRIAAATRCLAEVHMRAGNLEEATRTAFLATVHLQGSARGVAPENRQLAVSLRGAALLSAAAASARRHDAREAHAALKAAAVCADELGHDRADLATVFGPTNVAIHQVAIAVELGDAREAVRRIPAVQLDRMPTELAERRSRFLIDVARSYTHVRNDEAAIGALVEAERIAQDELRHHRLTREVVAQLLTRERRSSELRALAERCQLLTKN